MFSLQSPFFSELNALPCSVCMGSFWFRDQSIFSAACEETFGKLSEAAAWLTDGQDDA